MFIHVVQGKCDDPAPDVDLPASHAPLLPLEKDQCLLFASSNLISVNSSNLWIDKLYIRFTTARDVEFTHLIEARGAAGNLWTTNTTLQGNGDGLRDCWACGIYTWEGAKSYAEGVVLCLLPCPKLSSILQAPCMPRSAMLVIQHTILIYSEGS